MAETFDLDIVQNETFTRVFSNWIEDGVPQSFTGWTAMSQIRKRESVESELALDLTPYFTVTDGGATLTLRVPATVTAALDPDMFRREGGAYWDVFLVDELDPSNAQLFMEGRATLNRATTKVGV